MRSATPLAVFLCVASALNAQKITTFDVPNETYTIPTGISTSGDIVGTYFDENGNHGFLRKSNGKFTTFNVANYQTYPSAVNSGLIVGSYVTDLEPNQPGFLRSANGAFTEVLAPAAFSVFPTAINPTGMVVGWYVTTRFDRDSFIRSANGSITVLTFGSIESQINAINPAGQTTGFYSDSYTGDWIGFLRQPDGNTTTFTLLNAAGTFPFAINARGQIAGSWRDSNFGVSNPHGFIRDVDGTTITIDYPGAMDTQVLGIDSRGSVAGVYSLSSSDSHAFVRDPDGTFTTIEISDSTYTTIVGMNPRGDIVGVFFDSSGKTHGWVRTP